MQTLHIALVPESGGLSPSELLRVSAALQKQASTQLGPYWELEATVDAFAEIEDVPAGYRPIVLSLPDKASGAAGVHLDENGQPYARVLLAPGWSLAASRACLEMLVNPYGRRTITAPSPRSDQGPAEVLVEVCGPFGDVSRAYLVNDVPVADFCTPAYYDTPGRRSNERYSFGGGSFSAPLQILRGGHLAWFDAISNSWWLRSFHDEHPTDVSLGTLRPSAQSVRELVSGHAPTRSLPLPSPHHESLEARVGLSWLREQAAAASRARGQRLRELLVGGREITDGIASNAPIELHSGVRTSPPPLPYYAASASAARKMDETIDYAAPAFEHALRAVVAAELESALDDDAPTGTVAAPAVRTAQSEYGESAPIYGTHTLPQFRADPRQPARAEVHARPQAAHVADTIPPPAPVPSVAHAPTVPVETLRAPTPVPAAAAPTMPAAPAAASAPASAARKIPTVPPSRPSSIAPIAMLESRERPQTPRMGMVLTGVAVAGLAVALLARGDSSRSAPQPAQQPQVAAATSAPLPAAPAPAPAQPVTQASPAPAEPQPIVQPLAANPAPAPAAPARAVAPAPAPAPTRTASANVAATPSAKASEPSERRRRQRANEEIVPAGNIYNPTPEAKPSAGIEGLFDTRR